MIKKENIINGLNILEKEVLEKILKKYNIKNRDLEKLFYALMEDEDKDILYCVNDHSLSIKGIEYDREESIKSIIKHYDFQVKARVSITNDTMKRILKM